MDSEMSTPMTPDHDGKYRAAADIANSVLKTVVAACVVGADIATICELGDKLILEASEKVYTKRKPDGTSILRGIAFPTCISCDDLAGNVSPLLSNSSPLVENSLVKVDLGCHIDGYIATTAHSFVLTTEAVSGRQADVLLAAWYGAQVAIRAMKVGASSKSVSSIVERAVKEFNCNLVQGVESHELRQHIIDGTKCIVMKETAEVRSDRFSVNANDVFSMDIVVSTGDGKMRDSDLRTTVFKREMNQNYVPRTALGRQFLKETSTRFPTLPFSLRAFSDEKMARVGIAECTRNDLFHPYHVMKEKTGDLIAQFKFTIFISVNGVKKIAGLDSDLFKIDNVKSEFSIKDPELLALLETPAEIVKKPKKTAEAV